MIREYYAFLKTHTDLQIKKKWSDLKIGTKKRIAALRKSSTQTGGGGPDPGLQLTPTEERVAALMGSATTEGVLGDNGDTDSTLGNFYSKFTHS